MKKVLSSIFLLSCGLSTYAQRSTPENAPVYAQASEIVNTPINLTSADVTKRYFNANHDEIKNLSEAKFIQIKKKNPKDFWDIAEFYANGFLRMEGTFSDENLEVRTGKFKFYQSSGIVDFEGFYDQNIPTGEWKFYFPNGQMSSLEIYENGNRVKEDFWNEDGTSLLNKNTAERILPSFNGGQLLMGDYLKKHLHYPAEATANKVAGKVVVSFCVKEDGSIISPKIEESLGEVFDNEVIKMVNEMPKWLPAKHHNRAVKQMYILPVAFSYN